MEHFLILLQAAPIDPITLGGGAGWAGAGLLGLVLGWLLLWHLPNKDKQITDLVTAHRAEMVALAASKDKAVQDTAIQFHAAAGQARQDHVEDLRVTREEFKRILEMVMTNHSAQMSSLNESITSLYDAIQALSSITQQRAK